MIQVTGRVAGHDVSQDTSCYGVYRAHTIKQPHISITDNMKSSSRLGSAR